MVAARLRGRVEFAAAGQGLVDDARPLRAAVLEGYHPAPEVAARVPVHEVVTRARLAAVYAFHPGAPAS